jgi:uncharacterized protein (TIGR00369 family)
MGESLSELATFNAHHPVFTKFLAAKMTYASKERLEAEFVVHGDLTNPRGILHGGIVMALADHLGAAGTFVNLPPGASTTTLESKTNFFAAVPGGDTVRARCTPLHRGRTTMVWETRVFRGDGKLAAIVTQTQMVLPRRG